MFILFAYLFFPAIYTFYLSLLDRDGSEFVGIANYIEIFTGRLLQESGLGIARIARLRAAATLLERSSLEALADSPLLSCSSSVRRYLRTRLAHLPREVFCCLFLDNRHRLIRFEALFLGTVDRASVHPREVLRRALELNAAALIPLSAATANRRVASISSRGAPYPTATRRPRLKAAVVSPFSTAVLNQLTAAT